MNRWRSQSIHRISLTLSTVGLIFLVVGAGIGWLAPWLAENTGWPQLFLTPLSTLSQKVDTNAFLGANITALAVIIAVLIGYNISTLQIAGQLLSPVLVRAILLSLAPFLICWSVTTCVALVYFLLPPTLIAQMVQLMLWFVAVILLMIGYLWNLPWRLSGEHAALWAIRELQKLPMNAWEATDGYAVLQTGIAAASARSDLGTVRTMALMTATFLVSRQKETAASFDRGRYRSIKNLLSGCMQNAVGAPNAASYYLGYLTAGVLLRAVAAGCAYDAERDLFTGVFRALHSDPGRLDALWTGMRHGLFRKGVQGDAYLAQYWHFHATWAADDPRRVRFIAEQLAYFHTRCWRELVIAHNSERHAITANSHTPVHWLAHPASRNIEEVNTEAASMLADLYRDIARYLAKEVASFDSDTSAMQSLPQELLDAVHERVLEQWPDGDSKEARMAVTRAYESRRDEILLLSKKVDEN